MCAVLSPNLYGFSSGSMSSDDAASPPSSPHAVGVSRSSNKLMVFRYSVRQSTETLKAEE